MVQDTRGVDDLVSEIFVFGMADIQGLSCKGIRLDFDVGFADGVDEWGFADVGIACQEDGSFIRIDGGKTAQMFSDLFQVGKRGADFSDHGTDSTKCGSF